MYWQVPITPLIYRRAATYSTTEDRAQSCPSTPIKCLRITGAEGLSIDITLELEGS